MGSNTTSDCRVPDVFEFIQSEAVLAVVVVVPRTCAIGDAHESTKIGRSLMTVVHI